MKKIFGFMGVAALLTLGSCANDNFDGPEAPAQQKGDMFMTLNISQLTPAGTRTATPNQGVEVGQSYENKVSSALIIFAKEDQGVYKVFKKMLVGGQGIGTAEPEGEILGQDGNYAATFEMERSAFLTDITTNGTGVEEKSLTYSIFVVANPTEAIYTNCREGQPVQNTFTLMSDDLTTANATYWKKDNFLMSNSGVINETATGDVNTNLNTISIKESDIAVGKCTTAGTALNLGTVRIQRAMSRFDIEVANDYIVFDAAGPQSGETASDVNTNSDLKNIRITIDAVALVNQATAANLFKVTGSSDLSFTQNSSLNFIPETATNWVFTPTQTAFTLPMFGGGVVDGALTGNKVDVTQLTFTTIEELRGNTHDADNTFTHEGNNNPTRPGSYKIWRYCMENTNPNLASKQVNGNSTGIVIRAKMESEVIDENKGDGTVKNPIYAFSNVFLGNIVSLRNYANNPKRNEDETGVYELVNIRFHAAVDAYNASLGDDPENANKKFVYGEAEKSWEEGKGIKLSTATAEQLEVLDSFLVDREFSIYRPDTDGNYYCYYTYWNRHNDNKLNTVMGTMEFATVRNNVYKILFEKIHRLGHPGDPNDDPDPEDPDDPDEEDHFYITVACEILPWEVRMNGVEL